MRPAYALLAVLSAAALVYHVWSPSPAATTPESVTSDESLSTGSHASSAATPASHATAASVRPRTKQPVKLASSEPSSRPGGGLTSKTMTPQAAPISQQQTSENPLPAAASAADAEAYEAQKLRNSARPKPALAAVPPPPRWINELSGTKAKLNMGKARSDAGCQVASASCSVMSDQHDIKVVGVLIKPERLAKPEDNAIIDGQVKRGDHAQGTPAVYLQ